MHDRLPRPTAEPGAAAPLVEAATRALRGRGTPVDAPAVAPRGASLGHVRVHDDPLAHALAGALGAHAVTAGGDVALRGTDASHSAAVLGHELAHVVQQGGTPLTGPVAPTTVGDAVEQDAARRGGRLGS